MKIYSKKSKMLPFYWIWQAMKARCLNENHKRYSDYGGRGILCIKKWEKFENFYKDMYSPYLQHIKKYGKRNTTLERINNEKGYSVKNCKWATRLEQGNNKRNNHFLKFNNMRMTLNEWARYLNVKRSLLAQRYYVYKWNIKKTLTFNFQ